MIELILCAVSILPRRRLRIAIKGIRDQFVRQRLGWLISTRPISLRFPKTANQLASFYQSGVETRTVSSYLLSDTPPQLRNYFKLDRNYFYYLLTNLEVVCKKLRLQPSYVYLISSFLIQLQISLRGSSLISSSLFASTSPS